MTREYRYVETEKCDGKTLRTGGITKRSLAAMKHIAKLGRLQYVRGYVYRGRHNVNHIGVLVRGENGTVRFGGFGWGYGGEGPRGTNELFRLLGVDVDATSDALGRFPDFSDASVGEHWRIDLTELEGRKAA